MTSMIKDILIYGSFFIATLAFTYLAENSLRYKKRMGYYVLSFFALLIPCILAGLRADSVGTDVRVYAGPVFSAAAQRNFSQINSFYEYIEIGYRALALLVSMMTDNLGVFLAVSQLAVILPIYIVAHKRRRITPMWVTIAIYLCLFYCASFNLMRQCISAALLLLAVLYFEEKKYFRMLICIGIGVTFHNTILIGVCVYAVSYFVLRIKKISNQWIVIIIMSLIVTALYSYWDQILGWAIAAGLLPEKYSGYLNIFSGAYRSTQAYYFELGISQYIEVGYRVLFSMIGIRYATKAIRKGYSGDIMMHVTVVIICTLVELLTMVMLNSSYGVRIVWNNEFSLLLMLPALMTRKSISVRKTNVQVLVVALAVITFFGMGFIVLGWHGVTPFRFRF